MSRIERPFEKHLVNAFRNISRLPYDQGFQIMRVKTTTCEFINKASTKHCDKYDYSLVNYISAHVKIKIICPTHGEFSQTPNEHLRSGGCDKCGIESQRLTTAEFINKSIIKHSDKYDYSKVKYVDKYTKVEITCREHGSFFQDARQHYRGDGCPSCSLSGFKRKDDGTLYILRSNCGLYFKAGISNNVNRRLTELRRNTPFDFEPIAKINHDGDVVFGLEKAFHSNFESAQMKGFDGCTEWFKWESNVNDWIALLTR